MKKHCWWLAAAAAVLAALGVWSLAFPGAGVADEKKEAGASALPDKEGARFVADSVKTIESSLTADAPKKPDVARARTAAIMIAVYAQNGGKGPLTAKRATLRDKALELADLIKNRKFEDARKQARELLTLKADAKAKTERQSLLGNVIDVEEVMNQFASTRSGGLGVEKEIEDLAEGGDLKPEQLNDELIQIANRARLVAHLVKDKDKAKKSAQWKGFAKSMGANADELAAAVRKKDAKAATAAIGKLNKSCNACHEVFK
jgi:hypothetical protein